MPADRLSRAKPLVFAAGLAPALYLTAGLLTGAGVNPVEGFIRGSGDWALRFLLLTLTATPLRRLTGWGWPLRLRRMLGLFAFFYAGVHLAGYLLFEQFFDWGAIARDILERPFITLGMLTFLLLLPLAVTSTRAMQLRLGGRRWKRLHTLVYPAAVGAVVHFYLMVKADTREPLIYGFLLLLLFAARVNWRRWLPALRSTISVK